MKFFSLLLIAIACGIPATSKAGDSFPPMHKGVNFSGWLANAARQPLYDRDFRQVARAGFDTIRLPVNPEQFGFVFSPDSPGYFQADFAEIDKAIDLAGKNHVTIILDMHPLDHFMRTLENEPEWADEAFVDLWKGLAGRYKNVPADKLAFEILNEPQYYGKETHYEQLAEKVVEAIRAIDPQRTIIVCAPDGSSISGLTKMKALPETNIIYDFHYYYPYIFTHQGITSGFEEKMVTSFHNLPYPSSLVDHDAAYYAPTAPKPAQATRELAEYVDANWNRDHIADMIAPAKAWADENQVPLICGEFGVIRYHVDPASRYRWIEDARSVFEADNIGWQIWDYTDNFGISELVGQTSYEPGDNSYRLVDPPRGDRKLEPAALKALGLHPPK